MVDDGSLQQDQASIGIREGGPLGTERVSPSLHNTSYWIGRRDLCVSSTKRDFSNATVARLRCVVRV